MGCDKTGTRAEIDYIRVRGKIGPTEKSIDMVTIGVSKSKCLKNR
jgi:hypothetical protein